MKEWKSCNVIKWTTLRQVLQQWEYGFRKGTWEWGADGRGHVLNPFRDAALNLYSFSALNLSLFMVLLQTTLIHHFSDFKEFEKSVISLILKSKHICPAQEVMWKGYSSAYQGS